MLIFSKTLKVDCWKPLIPTQLSEPISLWLLLRKLSFFWKFPVPSLALKVLSNVYKRNNFLLTFSLYLEGFLPCNLFLCWRQIQGRSMKSAPRILFSKNNVIAFVKVSLTMWAHYRYWKTLLSVCRYATKFRNVSSQTEMPWFSVKWGCPRYLTTVWNYMSKKG